jgi:hypothetical protein
VDEGKIIFYPFLLSEVLATLKGFVVSKPPRTDGWTVEFFLEFLYLLGSELLEVVDDSRMKGKVNGALNKNFIALILKSDKTKSFAGFKPISLCNLIYNIIYKIIASRIKSYLSKGISKEQFGFLENRNIIEAIGVAREAMHSINIKKSKALVLKLDMMKAYDRFNWSFLRLYLL